MSAVSGIQGKHSLAAYLVQAAKARGGEGNDGDADDQPAIPAGGTSGTAAGGQSDLKETLLSTISDALKSASPDESPTDLFQALQDAVTNALKQNGGLLASPQSGVEASGGDGSSQASTLLEDLLNSSGYTGNASDLTSLLNSDAASAAGQPELVSLLQRLPVGFNFSAQA
ncbi:MAG: hypothetical protein KDA44_21225 [Planctomycetales bacterium]|nr:hypothetical protein [Planctomycetales bacterium]